MLQSSNFQLGIWYMMQGLKKKNTLKIKSSYNIFAEMLTFFLVRYVLYLKRKKKLGLNSLFLSFSSDFLKFSF